MAVRKGVSKKYVDILLTLYSNTPSRVRVYSDSSDTLSTTSGARQTSTQNTPDFVHISSIRRKSG
ncbi:unnamed protein product [Dicrocoelium dendriticum]|nr:unnamed protein product [Dicrocoelium dendriticum]